MAINTGVRQEGQIASKKAPEIGIMLLCVGGPPRSGTELMRQVLNRIPSIHIAAETHVFGDLLARMDCGLHTALSGTDRRDAIDYFQMLSAAPYGQHEMLSAAEVGRVDALEYVDPITIASLYEAYCRQSAGMAGTPSPNIWGDKTPRHIFAVELILQQFPNSKFLAMVRDPRAVVLSYRDWQNRWFEGTDVDYERQRRISAEEGRTRRSYHPATITLLWRAAAQAGRAAEARYPDRVRLVKFEELIENPAREVRAICNWLAVPFDEALLQVGHLNSSFVSRKDDAGFDRMSIDRWRTGLSGSEKWVVERLAGPVFQALEFQSSGSRLNAAEALHIAASFVPAVVSAAWVNRRRRGNLLQFLKERIQHL